MKTELPSRMYSEQIQHLPECCEQDPAPGLTRSFLLKLHMLSRRKTRQDWDFTQECVFIDEFVRKKDGPSVKRGDVASKQQGGMRPGWLPRSRCFRHDWLPWPGKTTVCHYSQQFLPTPSQRSPSPTIQGSLQPFASGVVTVQG